MKPGNLGFSMLWQLISLSFLCVCLQAVARGPELKPVGVSPSGSPNPPQKIHPVEGAAPISVSAGTIEELPIHGEFLRDYKVCLDKDLTIHFVANGRRIVESGEVETPDVLWVGMKRSGEPTVLTDISIAPTFEKLANFGDKHISLPRSNQVKSIWLTFNAGSEAAQSPRRVRIVKSRDGGASWEWKDMKTFDVSLHEPRVEANDESDALFLGTRDGTDPTVLLYETWVAHWNDQEWSDLFSVISGKAAIGNTFLPSGSPGAWWVYSLDTKGFRGNLPSESFVVDGFLFQVAGKKGPGPAGRLTRRHSVFPEPIKPFQDLDSTNEFRYQGGSLHVQGGPGASESWMVAATQPRGAFTSLLLTKSQDGWHWTSPIPVGEQDRHRIAAHLAFDPIDPITGKGRFYLFYLRIGSPTSYDICFKSVEAGASAWPSEETVVLGNIRGKPLQEAKENTDPSPNDKTTFGNNFLSGAVYRGRIAIIYQESTGTGQDCRLKLWHN